MSRNRKEAAIAEDFVTFGNARTAVLKLGHFGDKPETANSVVMLIIPGNPGVPHYYEDFMQELYNQSGGQIPVWTIGHTGHIKPPGERLSLADIYSTREDVFGLEAQISDKVKFIKENIPTYVSLILIGHSIGCYMILNMLDQLNRDQVLHCFLLFPTLEHMALTPNGRFMTPILRHLRWLVVISALFINILPRQYRLRLVHRWFRHVDHPKCVKEAVLQTLTPWTVNYTTYLAKIEMNTVNELQKDLLQKHASKLTLYYGACDHWAPKEYYHDLVQEFPEIDARLCELNMKHAFVLQVQESQQMAKMVWEWAQPHCKSVISDNCVYGADKDCTNNDPS